MMNANRVRKSSLISHKTFLMTENVGPMRPYESLKALGSTLIIAIGAACPRFARLEPARSFFEAAAGST